MRLMRWLHSQKGHNATQHPPHRIADFAAKPGASGVGAPKFVRRFTVRWRLTCVASVCESHWACVVIAAACPHVDGGMRGRFSYSPRSGTSHLQRGTLVPAVHGACQIVRRFRFDRDTHLRARGLKIPRCKWKVRLRGRDAPQTLIHPQNPGVCAAKYNLRMRPTGIKADRARGELTIQWDDGHSADLTFAHLASNCRCATCNDNRAKLRISGKTFVPESSELLAIEAVGSYGISIVWKDGCRYGIYTWEVLAALETSNPNIDGPIAVHSAF